jgi:DNA-binding CsgD family transcriptional regulator
VSTDAVSIVEAAYDLEGDTRAWLKRLLEAAAQKLDQGLGVGVSMYGPGIRPEEALFDTRNVRPHHRQAGDAMIVAYPEIFHRVVTHPSRPFSTPTEAMGMTLEQAQSWAPYVEFLHPVGIREFFGVLSRDPSGYVVFLSAGSTVLRRPSRRERSLWGRIAAHIGAGARVRRALTGLLPGDVSRGADAVLSVSGALEHAEPSAQGTTAREALHRAARAIDRARSKARSNEDEALDLWRGLVAGRWSLVDRFDTDGRRFLVARKNDPQLEDPRALSLRERQVLAYAAMGHPLKLIAYELGLSASVVGTHRANAMRKLGLRSHADVVRLFAQPAKSATFGART